MLVTLILAQWALLVHQFEHHVNLEATATEDCTLCSFASTMAAPPPSQAYVTPPLSTTAHIYVVAAHKVTVLETPSDFQARAPPSPLSA